MTLQIKEKHKINFGVCSDRNPRHSNNNDDYGKFPNDHSDLSTEKGQLFIIADSKTTNPNGKNAGKMAVDIIQKNYFTYPSDDLAFSLQRAFDTANRYIYQYSQATGLHRRIGATCSALVLTEKHAYIAHVGDCCIYRVNLRRIEKLTRDHVRIIETMPKNGDKSGKPVRRAALSRALGVKLGIKVDTSQKIPVQRDEFFVLCTDGLKNVNETEIQRVVLSSSPERAAQKLALMARARGGRDDITVEVIKIYNQFYEQPLETYAHVYNSKSRWSNWPIYFMLVVLMGSTTLLLNEPLLEKALALVNTQPVKERLTESKVIAPVDSRLLEQKQLKRAKEYFNKGRWDEALKEYKAVLHNNHENNEALAGIDMVARAYTVRGDRAFSKENWGAALFYYKKALRLNPKSHSLRNLVVRTEKASYRTKNAANIAIPSQANPPVQKASMQLPQTPAAKAVSGLIDTQWLLPGLEAFNDYQINANAITFFENIRIKKAFHREMYDGVEVEVQARWLGGNQNGKFGIIFGHDLQNGIKPNSFMLFTVDRNGNYSLQRVSQRSVRILVADQIKPGIIGNFNQIHLKVKSFGKLTLLYANGVLLKMVPNEWGQHGGVGLYVDPKLRMEFSHFRILPTAFEQ